MNQKINNDNLGQQTIVVVGDGVAALCCLRFLAEKKTESTKLVQIAPSKLIPVCSERDLVFVSSWGRNPDREELPGAVQWSWNFYFQHYRSHAQIFKHSFLARPQHEQNQQALGVFPRPLLKQMREELATKVQKIDDLVIGLSFDDSLRQWQLQTHNQLSITANKIILCTGAFDFLLQDFGVGPIQGVNGTYVGWQVRSDEWAESFIISHAGHNLAFDVAGKKMWMGGTRDNLGHLWPRHDLINKMRQEFVENWKGGSGFISHAPDILSTGVRAKFPKGVLYAGPIGKHRGLYYLNGLYKNGFSYTPFLANELVNQVVIEQE